VSDWFFMVGQPLADAELAHVQEYLKGLGIDGEFSTQTVSDWSEARSVIDDPAWDRRWWEAEQRERRRLYGRAVASHGEAATSEALSRDVARASEAVHGSAAVEAARSGCTDAGLIRAAAGAASESLYLAALARLAGEGDSHPFLLKQSLFAGGHWPLGIKDQRYFVF
jgi:hypothetical protein